MSIIHNLVARFGAETGTFDRKINKSRTHMTRFGKDVQKMGKQMLAIAGVGGGIYALQRGLKSVIKAASDMTETQSKFDVVFRGMTREANKWAVDFGDSVGRSELAVKSWMARLQDTFVPLGFAREEAMKMSQELAKLAVDVASFNNAADADVIRDFTSALVGNHETVRKYGILISENRLKQMAMTKGIADNYKALTDLEKVQLRFNNLLADTKDAQGDALRTAGEYANQVKRLEASWQDLKVVLGTEILPAASATVEFLTQAVKEIKTLRQNMKLPMELKPTPPMTPPKEFWDINSRIQGKGIKTEAEEFEAFARKWKQKNAEFFAQIKAQNELRKQAATIAEPYLNRIKTEIELTGKVGEARQHAAQMIKLEEKFKKEGLKGTIAATEKIRELSVELKRLEKAQKLERIAKSVGDAFANAFERMIFEAEKFRDVMKSLIREIGVSVFRNLVTEPISRNITMALGGIPATEAHGGGIIGQIGKKRNVPALAFAGAPRLHRGFAGDEYPAILQRGEQVVPRGGGMASPTIIINNNTGQRMRQDGQPFFDGSRWVLNIVADGIERDMTFRKLIASTK